MSFDLGLTGEGGGQYIRYNASTGTWNVDGNQVQLGQFLVDITSLKTGWGKIVAGTAPSWQWDTRPGVKGDQPSDEHKRGFLCNCTRRPSGNVNGQPTRPEVIKDCRLFGARSRTRHRLIPVRYPYSNTRDQP